MMSIFTNSQYGNIPAPRVKPPTSGVLGVNYGTPTVEWILAEFEAFNKAELVPARKDLDTLLNGKVLEKVQILDGTRNLQSKPKAAVRFEDLRFMKDLPSVPPTARKAAGATVSVEEYNRLVDDVTKLYNALGAVEMIVARGNV